MKQPEILIDPSARALPSGCDSFGEKSTYSYTQLIRAMQGDPAMGLRLRPGEYISTIEIGAKGLTFTYEKE